MWRDEKGKKRPKMTWTVSDCYNVMMGKLMMTLFCHLCFMKGRGKTPVDVESQVHFHKLRERS